MPHARLNTIRNPNMASTLDEQIHLLARRCDRMLTEHDLRKKLTQSAQSGKPLRIKLGMDPTAPDVTLGHAVPLRVIRQFQEWGHKAVLIIGDYTARVGDPTGPQQDPARNSPARKLIPTPRPMSPRWARFSSPIRTTWRSATTASGSQKWGWSI